jgi:hypothetical protein
MLERRKAVDEAGAAPVDERAGFDGGLGIAEALEDFGPAIDTVGVGLAPRTRRGLSDTLSRKSAKPIAQFSRPNSFPNAV